MSAGSASPLASVSLVLFDVGGVLIRLTPWDEVFGAGGAPPGAGGIEGAVEKLQASEVFHRFERGRAAESEMIEEIRAVLSAQGGDEAIRERYLSRLGPPVEGMERLIENLRARGLRVAALSNTCPIHLPALRRYGFAARLERLVASCELGCAKPSREAFEKALALLGNEPERTFFVDDLSENVEGAREAGLRATVFDGPARLRAELGL